MEFLKYLIDLFLNLDKHLGEIIRDYGVWTYLILCAIIFCETGLVVTPLLPGDSLLFAAGTFAAIGDLNVHWLVVVLSAAAILGDTVNYWIGAYIGPKAFSGNYRFLKKEYLDRTHRFYEKYGGKAIILARFVPIVRTFAPFVAGIGAMNYGRFIVYNVVGGIAWVAGLTYAGYFFADNALVRERFSLVILAIVAISVMPMVVEFFLARRRSRRSDPLPGHLPPSAEARIEGERE